MIDLYMGSTANDDMSRPSSGLSRSSIVRFRCFTMSFKWVLLLCFTAGLSRAQSHDVICSDGAGDFQAGFQTGVKLHVGAARSGGLATRACEATLKWDKQQLIVADKASRLDVDALGIDLGLGVPVVTFQVRKSSAGCCMEYRIYSLQKPSGLLRVITGGDYFSAADTDLDGRVEIWTDDAASVDAFEDLSLSVLDFAPPIVLRFSDRKLLDVSPEFQPYFDHRIAMERAGLDRQDLRDFKSSDGRLAPDGSFPVHLLYKLRNVKMKVLEIVWSYLYSGREEEAWRSLAEMWPAADVDRIRAALLDARSRGIRSQIEGVSTEAPDVRKKKARIYDARTRWAAWEGETDTKLPVVPPEPILIEHLPPSGMSKESLLHSQSSLELVIDSAGKVRSAKPYGSTELVDVSLVSVATKWKFIPAFRDGRAVASRIHFAVDLKR
jgi:hypothetical protein